MGSYDPVFAVSVVTVTVGGVSAVVWGIDANTGGLCVQLPSYNDVCGDGRCVLGGDYKPLVVSNPKRLSLVDDDGSGTGVVVAVPWGGVGSYVAGGSVTCPQQCPGGGLGVFYALVCVYYPEAGSPMCATKQSPACAYGTGLDCVLCTLVEAEHGVPFLLGGGSRHDSKGCWSTDSCVCVGGWRWRRVRWHQDQEPMACLCVVRVCGFVL